MPQGAEARSHEPQQPAPSRPELRVIPGGAPPPDLELSDEPDLSPEALARAQGLEPVPALQEGDVPDNPDLSEEALARAQGLEPVPAPLPEHHEATPESLINAPYLKAARDQLVSAWADLRKYEHGLTGAVRGIVARKSKETARVRYEAARQAYDQALREQAQEIEREFGTIEKAKALISAMEQLTDARAEVVIGKNEVSRKLYQLWQKMGELNVGNIEAVKKILARQEDESAWKGKAKAVGRFIARGMSLRSAVGAAMVGSGFWAAYAGWRLASGAATGAGTYTLMREGMRVGSRELLQGSESKVRREYSEVELAGMSDQQLGELMQAYGARLGFHGEKLQGNARFERVRDAFLSRLQLVEENVQGRVDVGWDTEPRTLEEERVLEAMMSKKDTMLERLDGLSQQVEQELATKEKEDRRQRLIAAATALTAAGAIMYWRSGGIGGAEETKPIVRTAPAKPEMTFEPLDVKEATDVPEPTPVVPAVATVEVPPAAAPPVEEAVAAPPVEGTVAAAAQEATQEAVHEAKLAGVYTIKQGQGLLHAANEFQKSQHDAIVSGIKTQHPEWFAKGEDFAIRKWRLEQVRAHGGDITAAGEKYTETLHPGAKIQLEFDKRGYPHLTGEDEHITHDAEKLRPRVEAVPQKPDFGFEKWGDNHPIRFSKEGIHGTLIPYGEGAPGEFVLDVRDIHVDDRALERFIDPNVKQALAERFKVGDDPAALAVLEDEARKLGKELAARHAALEYLKDNDLGTSAMADELRREIDETIQKAHWRFEDAQVFRPVSPAPEEVAKPAAASAVPEPMEAASAPETALPGEATPEMLQKQIALNPAEVDPAKLAFPQDWTSAQQEATRRVVTYHQELARSLQKLFDSYAAGHADDPLLAQVREYLKTVRETALVHDEQGGYAVQDMLQRIAKDDPGKIPTVELTPGTSTIKDSAWVESEGIFDSWVRAVRGSLTGRASAGPGTV